MGIYYKKAKTPTIKSGTKIMDVQPMEVYDAFAFYVIELYNTVMTEKITGLSEYLKDTAHEKERQHQQALSEEEFTRESRALYEQSFALIDRFGILELVTITVADKSKAIGMRFEKITRRTTSIILIDTEQGKALLRLVEEVKGRENYDIDFIGFALRVKRPMDKDERPLFHFAQDLVTNSTNNPADGGEMKIASELLTHISESLENQ